MMCNTKTPGRRRKLKKIVIQKISVVFLTLIIAFSSCPVRVNATAGAFALETSAEFTELLYSLIANAMLAAGATNFQDISYESAADLFNSFMFSLKKSLVGTAPGEEYVPGVGVVINSDSFTVQLSDGSVVSIADILESYSTDGSSALDEETWSNFRVINGGGSGGSGDDPNNNNKFDKIDFAKIGSDFLMYMGAWIDSLWNNAISGLSRDDYFYDELVSVIGNEVKYQFDGTFDMDENGNYIVSGSCLTFCDSIDLYQRTAFDYSLKLKTVGYLSTNSNTGNIMLNFCALDGSSLKMQSVKGWNARFHTDGRGAGGTTFYGYCLDCEFYYNVNIPVFSSEAEAIAYLNAGTETGIMNGLTYDYGILSDSIASALNPFADAYIDADAIPDLYPAISAAVDALPDPEPASDPAKNANDYVAAVAAAATAAAPDPAPDPDPADDPEPVPELDPAIKYEIDRAKFDFTEIFPFCIPFDLVKLLDALCADPVAPRFEIPFVVPVLGIDMVWVIDMSIFDTAAEVFRTGIVVGYVIFLLMNTFKLIKW